MGNSAREGAHGPRGPLGSPGEHCTRRTGPGQRRSTGNTWTPEAQGAQGTLCTWVEYGDAGTSETGCARGWAFVSVWVQSKSPRLGASWRGTLARPKAKAPSAHQGGTRGDVVALSPQNLSSGVLGARRGQIGPSLWPSRGWQVSVPRAGSGGDGNARRVEPGFARKGAGFSHRLSRNLSTDSTSGPPLLSALSSQQRVFY